MYHKLGEVPHKRHTQFRREDGALYTERLMGTRGFTGLSSILYHHYPPTRVQKVETLKKLEVRRIGEELKHHHLRTKDAPYGKDPIEGRKILLFNQDVSIAIALPTEQMDYYYTNGEGDELYFVHQGSGLLHTIFGTLNYREGDYMVIPRGTIYRLTQHKEKSRFLVIESVSPVEIPSKYRNEFGQLLEHSPYCERDIRRPDKLDTFLEEGHFEVRVKARGHLTSYHYGHHPFDVVGWDGYLYPWILNIEDFEPVTGRIHQPPPVHLTFQGERFVVCSFVPRLMDYHPEAVPIPYHHSNVHCDEVLYYVSGNFMSRRGIEQASFTIHPAGIPHGPQPGLVEKSLGMKETAEMAVMVDTFRPLSLTEEALDFDDPQYPYSWL
jgi:homogentisate 1,2-dioxygenase